MHDCAIDGQGVFEFKAALDPTRRVVAHVEHVGGAGVFEREQLIEAGDAEHFGRWNLEHASDLVGATFADPTHGVT